MLEEASARCTTLGHDMGDFVLRDPRDSKWYVSECSRCCAKVHCAPAQRRVFGEAVSYSCDEVQERVTPSDEEHAAGRAIIRRVDVRRYERRQRLNSVLAVLGWTVVIVIVACTACVIAVLWI
jgi:hypothetical protein